MSQNKLVIPKLELDLTANWQDNLELLRKSGGQLRIETLNWAEQFPYKPDVLLSVAYTDQGVWLNYDVDGLDLRTLSPSDGNYVYTDSCVEFFMQKVTGPAYINLEFNAAGVCYGSHHTTPEESVRLSPDEFKLIHRWGTHLGEVINRSGEEEPWQMMVFVPWQLLGYTEGLPQSFRANFYKCGDETAHPHYVSWTAIDLPKPAFHCPEFFGEVILS